MKNIIGILVTTLIFIGLIITSVFFHLEENKSHQRISLKTFEEKIKSQETFVIFIKNTKNSSNPNIEEITKVTFEENKIKSYYIDIKNLDEKEYSKLVYLISIETTPTIAFFKDGKEVKDSRLDEFEDEKMFKQDLLYNIGIHNYKK